MCSLCNNVCICYLFLHQLSKRWRHALQIELEENKLGKLKFSRRRDQAEDRTEENRREVEEQLRQRHRGGGWRAKKKKNEKKWKKWIASWLLRPIASFISYLHRINNSPNQPSRIVTFSYSISHSLNMNLNWFFSSFCSQWAQNIFQYSLECANFTQFSFSLYSQQTSRWRCTSPNTPHPSGRLTLWLSINHTWTN